ncbi:MAG: glycosyltransferase family 87 protein [Armatimonadota bacterium]
MVENPLPGILRWLVPQLRTPLLAALLFANVALHVGYLLPLALSDHYPMADADVYAMAGRQALTGQPLYPLTPEGDPRTPEGEYLPFLYPPPFAALLAPLGMISQYTAVRVLKVLTFLAFWLFAASLCRLTIGKLTWRGTLGAALVATLTPGAYFNLVSGQVDPFLWLLLALALLTPLSGVLLAASCLVKPFAAWPLVLALWRQPRRVLPQAIVTLGVGVLLGGLICGWEAYAQWLHYTPQRMYGVIFVPQNISFSLLPLRLLGWQELPSWGRAFLMGMYLLGPASVAWLARRRPFELQLAWVAAAAILFAPFSRLYYLPLLLIPLALEVREALRALSSSDSR